MDLSIRHFDLLAARRDPRLTNALSLARAVERSGGVPWAMVLCDPKALRGVDPDAERYIRGGLPAIVGGHHTRGILLHPPPVEWLRWIATSFNSVSVLHDPTRFEGRVLVIDSMTSEVVQPDPRHVLYTLAGMLGASVEFRQPPDSYVSALMHERAQEVTDEQWQRLQQKVAHISHVGWFRSKKETHGET